MSKPYCSLISRTFFAAELPRHAVRYLSLENLKGAAISIVIGALVYLLFVRKVLKREETYVNLWPAKLDLEDLLYRPLLLCWLPGFFGRLSAVFGENKILTPAFRDRKSVV